MPTTIAHCDLRDESIIDSREIIEAIDFLKGYTPLTHEIGEWSMHLAYLTNLNAQGESATSDWPYGATLIRDDCFEDYARDLADDLGLTEDGAQWPHSCIDWKRAARELQIDYTPIQYGTTTYWCR